MYKFYNFCVDVIPFLSKIRKYPFLSYTELKENIEKTLKKLTDGQLIEEKLKLQLNIEYHSNESPSSVAALLLSLTAMCISLYNNFLKNSNEGITAVISFILYFIAAYYVFKVLRYRKSTDNKIPYYKLKLECVEGEIKRRAEIQKIKATSNKSKK